MRCLSAPLKFGAAYDMMRYSCGACRADLLEALPADDLVDMKGAVLDALQHVTGETADDC